ncbi:hypothetical protein ACFL6S_01305 [Candidatus Poribacteria bacterium]
MLRFFTLAILSVVVVGGGIFIAYGSQDEESVPSLDNVEFREVRIIPTSESVYSMMPDVDIAELGEMVMSSDEDIIAYGFSDEEKTLHQKFFAVGNLYADLMLKLSGEFSKDVVVERIRTLQAGLDNLGAPDAIYIYLFNLEHMTAEEEYPGEVIKRFLTMLYPFIEEFAREAPSGALVSLQAGHWLVDLGVVAAGESAALTGQSESARFFADTYTELDAPKGVINAFEGIVAITAQPELDDEDFQQIMMLSEDIRRFLR